MKPKYCFDCSKPISKWGKLHCRSCAQKYRFQINPEAIKGKANPNYKNGRHLIEHHCRICGISITPHATICKKCHRGENCSFFKPKKATCIDCGQTLKESRTTRCKQCHLKYNKGENHPGWKGGKPRCVDCGTLLSSYKAKRCKPCSNRYQWTKQEFRDKALSGRNIKPTKPEMHLSRFLNEKFPNEYRYVGDGNFWIERFNPDFINCNGKKIIIELFGDYWHSLVNATVRDKERIATYQKYGYQTLIIHEKELKNTEKLYNCIYSFTASQDKSI